MTDHAHSPARESRLPAVAALRLRVQARVVRALLIRELMTRYGRRNIGFLWLIAEPLILTGGILVVWSLSKRSMHGVPIIAFALTGYSMLTVWRHVVAGSVGSLRSAMPLLFHQNVRIFDAILSRSILDVFGAMMSFTLAYVTLLLFDVVSPVHDYLLLASAWGLMSLLSFGVGLIVAGSSEMWPSVERFIQPFMYLTLPLSGVFTMMAWLPDPARDIFLYSPLVHANEMFRAGFMGDMFQFYFDVWYLAAWALGAVVVGTLVVREAEGHIHYG